LRDSLSNVSEAKALLRKSMRARLRELAPEQHARASARICARLEQAHEWQIAKTVLLFAPRADEPDLTRSIQAALGAGKAVALPQFDAGSGHYRACRIEDLDLDLRLGQFGIREPAGHCLRLPLKPLDLILVPGLAFDARGHRLGRGRGYYDRLLAGVGGLKCGVGFDEQMTGQIPVEAHDILLDCILTPSCWLDVRRQGHGNELAG
jgi:5-formyltetrahydrofolate cyclo-ligase